MPAASLKIMRPVELKELVDSGEAVQLVDVREAQELAINRIPGSIHIPMNEIPSRLGELDQKARTVVHCHHGMRSYQVAMYLLQSGFEDVANLDGGIDAYALAVDPSLGHY